MLHLFLRITDKLVDLLLARIEEKDTEYQAELKKKQLEEKNVKKQNKKKNTKNNNDENNDPKEAQINKRKNSHNLNLDEFPNFKLFIEFIQTNLKIQKPYFIQNNQLKIIDLTGARKLKLFETIDLAAMFPGLDDIKKIDMVNFKFIIFLFGRFF